MFTFEGVVARLERGVVVVVLTGRPVLLLAVEDDIPDDVPFVRTAPGAARVGLGGDKRRRHSGVNRDKRRRHSRVNMSGGVRCRCQMSRVSVSESGVRSQRARCRMLNVKEDDDFHIFAFALSIYSLTLDMMDPGRRVEGFT